MKRTVLWLGIFAFCGLLASSCSRKTLSIFFDGVPKEKQVVSGQTEQQAPVPTALYQHAPYAEKACDSCHDPTRTNMLVAPREQLCFTCHDFDLNRKYIHGPLASGGCLLCHAPHSSPYPKLLISESSTFCVQCHDPNSLPGDEPHQRRDLQCISCHDAHMSDKQYLLK